MAAVPGTIALLALLCVTCTSIPKPLDPLLEPRIPLDPGAMAYVFATVPEARPILNRISIEGYNSAQVAEVLDKTQFAVAALYPPESGRGIRAVTWGKYPNVRAGFAFSMSKDWKRQRASSGAYYWYAPTHRLSLALSSSQAFVSVAAAWETADPASREAREAAELAAGPFTQGPGVEVPEGFNAFREGSYLALWMENPAEPLDRFLSALRVPLRIPAEQLMAGFSTLPAQDSGPDEASGTLHEIKLRIKVPSEATARSMMTLFSTARIFILRSGSPGGLDGETFQLLSLLFTRPMEQEGAYLTLHSPPMDEEAIALLFNLFSVYSQGGLVTN
ncbi:MAG: hypothetical protein LBU19_10505 [Treponema sp.]|jgi:hypothetical protein|nr:hypothetical protein [Treponema sp.]